MGYRYPESVARDFDDQFKWDGHGWLFRRFHRARPVRVTADEMEQSIAFYHRWRNRAFYSLMAAAGSLTVVAVIGGESLEVLPPDAFGIAGIAIAWLGRNWAWRRATNRFARRVPVGQAQSWLEDRKEVANTSKWGDLLFSAGAMFAMAFLLWPFHEPKQWLNYAVVAVVGAAACFDIFIKTLARRS